MAAHDQQSGGQKTFRLARLFHTEDCYRTRALTAEELVRRTFIGVDAETFKKLDRQGSYYDITNCEDWHWSFDDRFQDAPTCQEIASAVERLGFFVDKVRLNDREHFDFYGVRKLDFHGHSVASRCVGCECQCDHGAQQRGTDCESCECACDGCYCAGNCGTGHLGLVYDMADPFLTSLEPDVNLRYRSRRFTLARRWHTDDCKVIRSFTADELVRMTFEFEEYGGMGRAIRLRGRPFRYVEHSEWQDRFQESFERPPASIELADAFMRRGSPIHYSRREAQLRVYLAEGSCNYLGVALDRDQIPLYWWPYRVLTARPPFAPEAQCGDVRCECRCYRCDLVKPGIGCADCDCPCEGCFCAGTCSDGHPVIQPDSNPRLSFRWQTLAGVGDEKRYENSIAWWHAPDCRTARWLTADQIASWLLKRVEDDSEGGWGVDPRCAKLLDRDRETRCGIHWINENVLDGPTCTELADAAKRAGIRVERLPKRWPWERTHFGLSGVRLGVNLRLESEPSCTGCECFCPLCDDCSRCGCECTGCVCGARCSTGECATVHEVISNRPRPVSEIERRLGTKRNMTPEDLEVYEALFRIEQGDITNQGPDGELIGDDAPRFELRRKAHWHRDGCEHPGLTLTALEIAYATLKRISEETMRDNQRSGRPMEHANCELWRHEFLAFSGPGPECELFVAAVKRLGYEVKPVDGMRFSYSYYDGEVRVSGEDEIHYEFPNADEDYRLWESMERPAVPDWDEARCDGRCECGCSHLQWFGPCECVGCYCPKTCVPAGVEE